MKKPRKKPVTAELIGLQPGDFVIVTMDDGKKILKAVRSRPWMLGHGEWVVKLEGSAGGFMLSRCKKTDIRPA